MKTLLQHGLEPTDVRRLRNNGVLRHLRHGWYATKDADPRVVRAVQAGGVLGCVSALGFHKVWQPVDSRLHVYRSKWGRNTGTSTVPWCPAPHTRVAAVSAVLPVAVALEQARHCASADEVLAMAESIIRQRLLAPVEVEQRLGSLASRLDRSDSGVETIFRERVRRRRIRIRPQVFIPGVGRVDFLIGELLVVEVDSMQFHTSRDAYHRDRHRDQRLVAMGYTVLRFTWEQVMLHWPQVEALLLAYIRTKRHRRRR